MALTVSTTPAKTVENESGSPLYTSRWVAVHNPIVFKIASSLFPTATSPDQISYTGVTESVQGRAVFAFSTIGSVDPSDLAPGLFLKVAGTVYNGEYEIIKYDPQAAIVELKVGFISDDTGTLEKAYRNYLVNLKVLAGLPIGHKWETLKPEVEIETLDQIPANNGVAVFDIQEAVKQKVSTENNLTLTSLPNDVNLWTGFRVSYQETYDQSSGVLGAGSSVNAVSTNNGFQTVTPADPLDLVAGDYVVLNGFDDTDYNGAVFRVVRYTGVFMELDLEYNAGISLNGYETVQKFNINPATFESGFTTEGNQYYAVNAKLAPRSPFGSNMAEYVNTNEKANAIKWLSGFEGKQTFAGYYDDVAAIIDESLLNSLATTEELAIEIKEFDQNENEGDTQYLTITKQDEGVYRLPFLRGIPPFIYQLSANAVLAHWFFVRPVEFQYLPTAVDATLLPSIELDGTVQSARGDNFKYLADAQTTTRDREVFSGQCMRIEAGNAGAFWAFPALGLFGVMTATVGWYKDSGGTVTLNKSLSGTDPEIDNINKRWQPQTDYKYHDVSIFEDGVLFGRYLCEQRFDEVWIDSSGNGNHLTGSSVVTPADLWTEDDVNFSYANGDNDGFGHSIATGSEVLDGTTITSGEIIPAITASLDADSGQLQYRGRCALDGKLVNSPAVQLAISATLTFDNTSPFTRPSVVTISRSDGTVAGSYDSGTGVFTISTAGVISSLTVDGIEVFLSTNGGIVQKWKQDSTEYKIVFSSLTWTTANDQAFNQSRGAFNLGAYIQSDFDNSILPFPATGTRCTNELEAGAIGGRTGVLKITYTGTGVANDSIINQYNINTLNGYSGAKSRQVEGVSVQLDFKIYIPTGTNDIFQIQWYNGSGSIVAISGTISIKDTWIDVSNTFNRLGAGAEISGYFIQFAGTPTNGDVFYIDVLTETTPNLFPSALDASGQSTGEDVFGNTLPNQSGFVIQDFGNSFKTNPNNAPALRAPFAIDDTETLTYAQIVEDINGSGVDRYVKGGDTKEDYIFLDTTTATPEEETEVRLYENR